MRRCHAIGAALLLIGCRDLDAEIGKTQLDAAYFRCEVQPVLIKSCGQLACHGDTARFFRVFGRNRLRYGLAPEKRNVPLSVGETAHNLEAAAGFVSLLTPEESLLLRKPLDQKAGGYYHGGATEYDFGDVFLAEDEPDYQKIVTWIGGAKADPACREPGNEGGGAP